jgi:flagellin
MTRINTNVSSLVAQNRLNRTNMDLQTSLTRLSTGLRINTGKDDPAGLIASEALRSDITSLNKAISNTRRAVQIIATADSALGQVSTLLNNIRGLIVEAANRGALSDDEIAANQLQIDSSLEAINRISQTTTFQGRKLLDGSLDFVSNISTVAAVTDSKINSANLGSAGSLSVDVAIEQAATQAELTATFDRDAASATLNLGVRDNILTNVAVSSNTITDDVTIEFVRDTNVAVDEVVAAFDADTNTITVSGNGSTATSITRADVAAAINALTDFSASSSATDGVDFSSGGTLPADATITGAVIDITAEAEGSAFNGVEIVLQAGAALGATYSASSRQITVTYVADTSDADDIAGAIDGLADFSATASLGGAKVANAGDIAANANTGFTGGEALLDNLVFELTGSTGAQSFNFGAGTTVQQIVSAINLLTDSTGVEAEYADGTLTLNDSQYGAKSLVAVSVISEGDDGEFQTNLSGIRDEGTDIVARINGTEANGSGNTLSINSTTLSMSLTVDPESTTTSFSFNITGGGALFQLGGEVVSNQQARLGIGSVSTSTLGGVNGRLYELGSGQEKALDSDINGAGKVIDEVIDKVTSLRGRLGAFQATTLESNLVSLTDTVANLTEAESSIRDADFAQESARLTRAQILIQSGTSVLAIANQNPQNVLSLLR